MQETCVPPPQLEAGRGPGQREAGKQTAWKSSEDGAGGPHIEEVVARAQVPRGLKLMRVDPTVAPSTVASPMVWAAFTQVRCCARRPGLLRPARTFSRMNGRPVARESVKALRTIWPPPSPDPPSIRTGSRSIRAR